MSTKFKADCGAVAEIDENVDRDYCKAIRTFCPKCNEHHEFKILPKKYVMPETMKQVS